METEYQVKKDHLLFLINGRECRLDIQDGDLLWTRKWMITSRGKIKECGREIYLHREIMERMLEESIQGRLVRHKSSDLLDNRRSNLYIRKDTSPGKIEKKYKGYSYDYFNKKYIAYIQKNGIRTRKVFKREEDAILWRKEQERV